MTSKHWLPLALLVWIPLSLCGQSVPANTSARKQPGSAAAPPSLYGGGFQTPSPAGLVGARNLFSLGANFATGYDDNISQSNRNRLAGTGLLFSPHLSVSREDGRMALVLSYRPTLLVYRHQSRYNEQDHDLNFGASFRATSRLNFHAQTNALFRSGLLDSIAGTTAGPEPASPGALNDTIATPFTNQFEDNSRAGVGYEIGPRATLAVFATYMMRSFAKSVVSSVPLYGTEGESAAIRYAYRTTPRSTLGLTYLYETFHTGAGTRVGIQAPSASWSVAVTPRLQLNLFGGPVFSNMRGSIFVPVSTLVTLAIPVSRAQWHWAAGGGIDYEAGKNHFRLSGSRQVTDGGGLLAAVTSDVLAESFERQLARDWKLQWTASWQRNVDLASEGDPGQLEGEYGRIVILRSLSEDLTVGAGYQFQRQRASGYAPLGASFDRNFVYFSLTYRFKQIPLGR